MPNLLYSGNLKLLALNAVLPNLLFSTATVYCAQHMYSKGLDLAKSAVTSRNVTQLAFSTAI